MTREPCTSTRTGTRSLARTLILCAQASRFARENAALYRLPVWSEGALSSAAADVNGGLHKQYGACVDISDEEMQH